MLKKPLIWLTRPTADSEVLAAQLAHAGIDSIIAPVMNITYNALPTALPTTPDAILITSRHCAPMLEKLPLEWRSIPVFCVGAATGTTAHDAGYSSINHGETGILDLLPRLIDTLPSPARILYLAGAETRVDVTALLTAQHYQVDTVLSYEAHAETALPSDLRDALDAGRITGIVFFSPRSAQIAATLIGRGDVTAIDAYCLSLAVAEAAGALPWRHLHACDTPTFDAMLHLIVSVPPRTML